MPYEVDGPTSGTRTGRAVVAVLAAAGADVALSYHSSRGITERPAASALAGEQLSSRQTCHAQSIVFGW